MSFSTCPTQLETLPRWFLYLFNSWFSTRSQMLISTTEISLSQLQLKPGGRSFQDYLESKGRLLFLINILLGMCLKMAPVFVLMSGCCGGVKLGNLGKKKQSPTVITLV